MIPTKKTPNDFPFKHSGKADAYGASLGGDYAQIQSNYDARAIYNQDQINEVIDAIEDPYALNEHYINKSTVQVINAHKTFVGGATFQSTTEVQGALTNAVGSITSDYGDTTFYNNVPKCQIQPTQSDHMVRKDWVDNNFASTVNDAIFEGDVEVEQRFYSLVETFLYGYTAIYDPLWIIGQANYTTFAPKCIASPTDSDHLTRKDYVDTKSPKEATTSLITVDTVPIWKITVPNQDSARDSLEFWIDDDLDNQGAGIFVEFGGNAEFVLHYKPDGQALRPAVYTDVKGYTKYTMVWDSPNYVLLR